MRTASLLHRKLSFAVSFQRVWAWSSHSSRAPRVKKQVVKTIDLPSTKRRLLTCISYLLWWICCGVFLTCPCDRSESSNWWNQKIKWCKVCCKSLNLACGTINFEVIGWLTTLVFQIWPRGYRKEKVSRWLKKLRGSENENLSKRDLGFTQLRILFITKI